MRRTFIYKQAHEGDPDKNGRFGIRDCMGKFRNLKFDAVIGVGGIGPDATKNGIAGKVIWVGTDPQRKSTRKLRGDLITFERFRYLGVDGPEFRSVAPTLAKRLYSKHSPRFLFDKFSRKEQAEIKKLLARARKRTSPRRSVLPKNTQPELCCDVSQRIESESETRLITVPLDSGEQKTLVSCELCGVNVCRDRLNKHMKKTHPDAASVQRLTTWMTRLNKHMKKTHPDAGSPSSLSQNLKGSEKRLSQEEILLKLSRGEMTPAEASLALSAGKQTGLYGNLEQVQKSMTEAADATRRQQANRPHRKRRSFVSVTPYRARVPLQYEPTITDVALRAMSMKARVCSAQGQTRK